MARGDSVIGGVPISKVVVECESGEIIGFLVAEQHFPRDVTLFSTSPTSVLYILTIGVKRDEMSEMNMSHSWSIYLWLTHHIYFMCAGVCVSQEMWSWSISFKSFDWWSKKGWRLWRGKRYDLLSLYYVRFTSMWSIITTQPLIFTNPTSSRR